jgi:hypothetical protein
MLLKKNAHKFKARVFCVEALAELEYLCREHVLKGCVCFLSSTRLTDEFYNRLFITVLNCLP